MQILIPGAGEFFPTEREAAIFAQYSELLPDFDRKDLLLALYMVSCIEMAMAEQSDQKDIAHVSGPALLSVAHSAALSVFGEQPKPWLLALGITSSASFGEAVFRLVRAGMLTVREQDKLDDFFIQSQLDDILK